MSVRRCPRCGSTFEGDARFCPKDGSPLIEVAGSPTRPAATDPAAAAANKTSVRRAVTPRSSPALDRAGSLSNQILDTRYQVMRKLGEGGMSYVYEARELSSGESVAIKVLSPKLGADQSSVERHDFAGGLAPLAVTVSIGVATYPGTPGQTVEELLAAADEALYRAKHDGRNLVRR